MREHYQIFSVVFGDSICHNTATTIVHMMNPAEGTKQMNEPISGPAARIIAQEVEYILSLREYLETNGCTVVDDDSNEFPVNYDIVAGDFHFVKRILSETRENFVKRLGIVVGSALHEAKKLANSQTKIVVCDPVHLTPDDVVDIISYFFTGTEAVYDKRRNIHEPFDAPTVPDAPEVIHETVVEEVKHDEDQKRIGSIISDVFKNEPPNRRTSRRRKFKVNTWMLLLAAICVFVVPVFWYLMSLSISGISLAYTGIRLHDGDTKGAAKISTLGNYWLTQSTLAYKFVSAPFVLTGTADILRGQERLISFLSDISSVYGEIDKIFQLETNVASLLLVTHKDGQGTPAPMIEKLRMSVTSVQSSLGLAQAQLATLIRDVTFPFTIPRVMQLGLRAQMTIEALRGVLTYVDQVLTIYPHIAGFRESKTYLVLLQNSNELRPTGGFIGSVGVAKFEDGFLSDFKIEDVYALDGQLKGHVDPPIPIREIMGNEHWYLRDSNWDPDFKVAAERASWFYEKETGVVVDGVIAVNVPVVTDLLQATGPIVLSDYNDRITAENFFGKSYYYTQNNFFPGSTQKSDFLGSLTRALMTKITSDKDVNAVSLFRAFASGVARRDIMFQFRDDTLERLVDHFGWSGRLFSGEGCRGVAQDSCRFDPLAVVEANMNVSKVNYFIKRNSIRDITIGTDGSVTETVTVSLKNTVNQSADANTPGIGGSYVPYMRFIVPAATTFVDVTLDNTSIVSKPLKYKTPPLGPYKEIVDGPIGTKALGVVFDVAPGVERQIRVTYKHDAILPFGRGGVILDLVTYKHPGVSDNVAKTVIHYPTYWIATDETLTHNRLPFVAKDGELEYNTTISQDLFLRLKFIK